MKDILFVGWVNQGKLPVDGETTKNQYIIAELEKHCRVKTLDFYKKNKHPWIYLQSLWAFVKYPQATIILSTSAVNVYSFLSLLFRLHIKRDIIHWVIGGSFADNVRRGVFGKNCVAVFNHVRLNLVQCESMVKVLKDAGLTNVKFVSNFKNIDYYPDLELCHKKRDCFGKLRFVFLSRIMPDKGCDYILSAARLLNEKGLADKYMIDFYGKIDDSYKNTFMCSLKSFRNVEYYGLLNLRSREGYDTLATYHAMLFPSFWKGEGFAGVFIDAFISGLPILASNWAHNAECIANGRTGVIYPTHDVEALRQVMEDCIFGKIDLSQLGDNARAEACKYESGTVMSEDYLKSIGLA